jgi:hypothetical protein
MYEKLNPKISAELHGKFPIYLCVQKLCKVHATFQLCVQKLFAKTRTNFKFSLQNSAKISNQCAFDCAKTLQNYTQISQYCVQLGGPESF